MVSNGATSDCIWFWLEFREKRNCISEAGRVCSGAPCQQNPVHLLPVSAHRGLSGRSGDRVKSQQGPGQAAPGCLGTWQWPHACGEVIRKVGPSSSKGARAGDKRYKLEREMFRLAIKENFPTVGTIEHWNNLPGEVAEIFKSQINKSVSNLA